MHVVCVVSEGDSPLKITWLKDGRPLNSTETTTHHIGEYDLTLMIQSATTAHNGNYTCVASNDAAETSRTASLLVHGTLERTRKSILLDPTTFSFLLLLSLLLFCPLISIKFSHPSNASLVPSTMITVIPSKFESLFRLTFTIIEKLPIYIYIYP